METRGTRSIGRLVAFVVAQAVILSVAVGATVHSLREWRNERALPPLRSVPLQVRPTYDCPWIVTDEQLERILRKLYPRLRGDRPKINFVDHALRLWGPEAVFDDPQALSGQELLEVLLDHRKFVEVWPGVPPFLIADDKQGVEIRTREGLSTSSHTDHTLATIAEAATPLDCPIFTTDGPATARTLVETSLREFSLDQMEYEWSALAYALYLPPVTRWRTTENQEITFDRLAERIMRERLDAGVCQANHRMFALVTFLRVDEQTPILTQPARDRIRTFLQDVVRRLVGSQSTFGYWDSDWWTGKPSQGPSGEPAADTLEKRIIGTGHALEWMALAPADLHPPRETLTRAAQWLINAVDQLDPAAVKAQYAFATHAGSALALWRGQFPAEFMKSRLTAPAAAPSQENQGPKESDKS